MVLQITIKDSLLMDESSLKDVHLDVVNATQREVEEYDILSLLIALKEAVKKELETKGKAVL